MPLQIEVDPTPLTLDADGNVRVGNTRITLENVLWLYKQGYGAEAVSQAFPSLSLSDIYSVIAYYLRHKQSVDDYLTEREGAAEQLRSRFEQQFGRGPSKQDLLARWASKYGGSGATGKDASTPVR